MKKIAKSIMLAVPMLALTVQGGLFGMDNKQELYDIIEKMPSDKREGLRSAMEALENRLALPPREGYNAERTFLESGNEDLMLHVMSPPFSKGRDFFEKKQEWEPSDVRLLARALLRVALSDKHGPGGAEREARTFRLSICLLRALKAQGADIAEDLYPDKCNYSEIRRWLGEVLALVHNQLIEPSAFRTAVEESQKIVREAPINRMPEVSGPIPVAMPVPTQNQEAAALSSATVESDATPVPISQSTVSVSQSSLAAPIPQPSETTPSADSTESSGVVWLVSLAVVFLAGIGYFFYRRKEHSKF